ncbi:MAG: protein translocase subunit SecD [Frankia sp.]
MARGSARTPGSRQAWTRIWVLVGLIVLLYATMVGTGNLTPKLGLDLQGGTSVILTPKPAQKGQKISSDAVNRAVDIIRQRVNGLGVAESTVQRAGNTIDISVPGKGRNDVVNLVGQTAELRFREVSTQAAAAPAPTPTPSASASKAPAASATPSASATPKAGGTPSAAATPKASATPSASATPKGGSARFAPGGTTTPPTSVQNYYNTLTCGKTTLRTGSASTDTPADWLAACSEDGTTKYLLKPAAVVGTDVKTATATLQQSGGTTSINTGQWEVNVDFTGKGQSKFTKLTEVTTGKYVAIVLDGVVQSAPQIQGRIATSAVISGNFTQKTSSTLASVLKYGSLPLTFEKSDAETISPTLGSESLKGGLIAGALGLGLVVLYFFLYYRALGLVAIGSLLVSGSMVYASVVLLGVLIGFTLSLAGIAGLIVSVGVTADSFVVFFERLKDEVREGRSVRTSVERAWVRARRTILSADTVSFMAAAILYILSIGSVRGFAFTLGLSTILDVVVVFLFTKPVVTLLVRKPFFSTGRYSGLRARVTSGAAQAGPVLPQPERARLSKRAPTATGGPASGGTPSGGSAAGGSARRGRGA